MTLEAQPNPQRPEGISAQQQERFMQLQTGIVELLQPRHSIIIVTSDSRDPVGGYRLSIDNDGRWSIGSGREGSKSLNEPAEPVKLLELLQGYAFIQNSSSFDKIMHPQIDLNEYLDKMTALEKSVEDDPSPFADSFLEHMENALKQLSRE